MREIIEILKAYQNALNDNIRTALATVVHVEGSSYRRPGARMLITEDGVLTGAISGGCLEGDALRKALSAIVQQKNKLIMYDTTDQDDAEFGIQLGCNGIVQILFEPIEPTDKLNPIKLLEELARDRQAAVLVTLFSMGGQQHTGTCMIYKNKYDSSKIPADIVDRIIPDADSALNYQTSTFQTYTLDGREVTGFLEFILPTVSLIIAGAGNDAQPLVEMASILGWEVTIVDGRPTHATPNRFTKANRILIAKPQQLLTKIVIDEQTAFVLMTHNYNYDIELLKLLLDTDAKYIGTLGPKAKLIRMLDDLDLNTEENQLRIHGPVGLDIGAETAEEIAISILAEIKSVFTGASAKFLKDKVHPIHFYEGKQN